MSTATESQTSKEMILKQLKGWAGALVKAIDKYTPQLLDGGPSPHPNDANEHEIPRDKVRRLVRQIGEIGVTVEEEVFHPKASAAVMDYDEVFEPDPKAL